MLQAALTVAALIFLRITACFVAVSPSQDPLSLPRAHQSAILSVLAAEDLARGGASPLARGGSSPLAAQQAVAAAGAEAAAGAAERSRALAAAAAAAAAPPLSTAVLLPLLRLATRAGSPEVRAAAGVCLAVGCGCGVVTLADLGGVHILRGAC